MKDVVQIIKNHDYKELTAVSANSSILNDNVESDAAVLVSEPY